MKVFIFDITNTSLKDLENASVFLSETEKNRLSNMISVKRRKEFILGHFLLRRLLCNIFSIEMKQAQVESMQTGALALPTMENVFASISHTSNRLAIAIGQTPVGIDIEKISPRDNFPALLNQIDAMDRAKELVAAGLSIQNAFYYLWCKREALYKLKSQTDIEKSFFYYNRISDFMMCAACNGQTDVEWLVKKVEDYYV